MSAFVPSGSQGLTVDGVVGPATWSALATDGAAFNPDSETGVQEDFEGTLGEGETVVEVEEVDEVVEDVTAVDEVAEDVAEVGVAVEEVADGVEAIADAVVDVVDGVDALAKAFKGGDRR